MLPSELDEAMLLERCAKGEESAVKQILERYEPKIFGGVLCLAACDRNAAYELTAASFAEALRVLPQAGARQSFVRTLLPGVIRRTRAVKASPRFEPPQVPGLAPERLQLLRLVKQALLALPFEARLLLVLRDLWHLRYEDIAVLTELPAKQARADTLQARQQLRDKTKEALERLT